MPPKRKKHAPTADQSTPKRRRVTPGTSKSPLADSIAVQLPTSTPATTQRRGRSATQNKSIETSANAEGKINSLAAPPRARAPPKKTYSKKQNKTSGQSIYDFPSSSEDELSRPATKDPALPPLSAVKPRRGRPRKLVEPVDPKVNGAATKAKSESPQRKTLVAAAKKIPTEVDDNASSSADELSRPTAPSTSPAASRTLSQQTPGRRRPLITYKRTRKDSVSRQAEEGLAEAAETNADESLPPATKTPRTARGKTVTGTPKTPATVAAKKPPRTRKKAVSDAPKTVIAAKMGVGVPGEKQEVTPSERKRRGMRGRKENEDHEVDDDIVKMVERIENAESEKEELSPAKRTRRSTRSGQDEQSSDEEEASGDSGIEEERSKPTPSRRKGRSLGTGGKEAMDKDHDTELSMSSDDDEDVDIVLPNGKIVPAQAASKSKATPKKATPRLPKQRLSLGTERLEDPFAMPNGDPMDLDMVEDAPATKRTTKQREKSSKQDGKTVKPPVDFPVSQDALETVQKMVLKKIMGRERLPLVGVDEEFTQVHQLLEQTITAGEGNSMLIIGARGSGKTTVIETALEDLAQDHAGEFHVVRLNGFLQTDDKLAAREIWRQLGVEMELDDQDQPKSASFADTLTSILAILSHPDELGSPDPETSPSAAQARTTTSVVFVLDEFDLFATHPRQTLLYNLFDIAQAKKAPITVLGVTCRVDVVDTLEKRVKSRFSHRSVHLKAPDSLQNFWKVCKAGLTVDFGGDVPAKEVEQYAEEWNRQVETLYEDPAFKKLLRRTYNATKTPQSIFSASMLAISNLTTSAPFLTADAFVPLSPPSSNLTILPSLSDLQIALIIAAARLELLADAETVSFEMVYDEYLHLCAKARNQQTPGGVGRVWSRPVAVAAWEGLGKVGLVVPALAKMWRVDVGLEEVRRTFEGTAWARWCKEIV